MRVVVVISLVANENLNHVFQKIYDTMHWIFQDFASYINYLPTLKLALCLKTT